MSSIYYLAIIISLISILMGLPYMAFYLWKDSIIGISLVLGAQFLIAGYFIQKIRIILSLLRDTYSRNLSELQSKCLSSISQLTALGNSQAVIEFTTEGIIQSANQNFLNTMGYSLNEIVGRHHSMFVDTEYKNSKEYGEFWEILRSGQFHQADYKRFGKDNKIIYIQATYFPVLGQKGIVEKVLKYAVDITPQKLLALESESITNELNNCLREMESGNLSVSLDGNYNQFFGRIQYSFNSTISKLRDLIQSVSINTKQLLHASKEVESTSLTLSNTASEQAATVEETEASIKSIISKLELSTNSIQKTEEVAIQSTKDAETGGQAVQSAVEAMKNIFEKTSIIHQIASQTSLLSLNASIEAARAGDMGRGFAVVAQEVGKLADLTNDSASEIANLSKSSVHIADNAGRLITDIIPKISHTSRLVQNVVALNKEQFVMIKEIEAAMKELDTVTQSNAALSEELAATSSHLKLNANQLMEQISFFQTTN